MEDDAVMQSDVPDAIEVYYTYYYYYLLKVLPSQILFYFFEIYDGNSTTLKWTLEKNPHLSTHFVVISQFNVSIIHKHLEDYYYEFYFDNPNFMVNVHYTTTTVTV